MVNGLPLTVVGVPERVSPASSRVGLRILRSRDDESPDDAVLERSGRPEGPLGPDRRAIEARPAPGAGQASLQTLYRPLLQGELLRITNWNNNQRRDLSSERSFSIRADTAGSCCGRASRRPSLVDGDGRARAPDRLFESGGASGRRAPRASENRSAWPSARTASSFCGSRSWNACSCLRRRSPGAPGRGLEPPRAALRFPSRRRHAPARRARRSARPLFRRAPFPGGGSSLWRLARPARGAARSGHTLRGQGNGSAGREVLRLRHWLVTGQVALTLVLLVAAGLFVKTLRNLGTVELGLKPDHLIGFSISPKLNGYSAERTAKIAVRSAEYPFNFGEMEKPNQVIGLEPSSTVKRSRNVFTKRRRPPGERESALPGRSRASGEGAGPPGRPSPLPSLAAQRVGRIEPRRAQGGRDAKREDPPPGTGARRNRGRADRHARRAGACRRREGKRRAARGGPGRDQEPQGSAGEGKEQAFHDRLPQKLEAVRADGQADPVSRWRAAPRAARSPARFEQAIRARARPSPSTREGRLDARLQHEPAVSARIEKDLSLDKLAALVVVPVGDPKEPPCREAGRGSGERLAPAPGAGRASIARRSEPSGPSGRPDRSRTASSGLHHHGNEEIRRPTRLDAGKTRSGNTDHRQWKAVDHDGLVQDRRVAAEAARPVSLRQDRHGMAAGIRSSSLERARPRTRVTPSVSK